MPSPEEWQAAELIAHDSFAKRCSGLFGEKWEERYWEVSRVGTDRKVWLGYWPKKPSGGGTVPKKAVCLSDALVEQLTGTVYLRSKKLKFGARIKSDKEYGKGYDVLDVSFSTEEMERKWAGIFQKNAQEAKYKAPGEDGAAALAADALRERAMYAWPSLSGNLPTLDIEDAGLGAVGAAGASWNGISGNLAPRDDKATIDNKTENANSQEEKVANETRPHHDSIGPPPSNPLPPLPSAEVGLVSFSGAGAGAETSEAGSASTPTSLPFSFDTRFYADCTRARINLLAAQKCALPGEEAFQIAERSDYGLGGQEVDHLRAHELYATARSAGHPVACAIFALREGDEWGEQCPLTEDEHKNLQAARQAGHPAAHYWYAKAVMNNTQWSNSSNDKGEAKAALQMATDLFHPEACFSLAEMLSEEAGALTGRDADALYVSAAGLYRTAAEQGHALGCESLATCYESGIGIKQSVVESEKWFQRAAASVKGEHSEAYEKAWAGYAETPAPTLPSVQRLKSNSSGFELALVEEENRQAALSTLLVAVKKCRHKAKRIGEEARQRSVMEKCNEIESWVLSQQMLENDSTPRCSIDDIVQKQEDLDYFIARAGAEAQREERERKEKKEEEARRQQQHEEMQKRQEEQRAAKKRLIQNEATSARGKIKHYRFIANSTTQEFSHFTLEQRQSVLQECDELERWLNARQESTTFEHIKKRTAALCQKCDKVTTKAAARSVLPPRRVAAPSTSPTKVGLNEQIQRAIENEAKTSIPGTRFADALQSGLVLNSLQQRFVALSKRAVVRVVREIGPGAHPGYSTVTRITQTPDEKAGDGTESREGKTISGGDMFLVEGVLLRVAYDPVSSIGSGTTASSGSSSAKTGDISARKIAGNELRGLLAFQRAITQIMHKKYADEVEEDGRGVSLSTVPTCLVDFCGLRFYTMCLAPIDGDKTLSYGRKGPGQALVGSGAQLGDKRCTSIVDALIAVEDALNLKPHIYERRKQHVKRSRSKKNVKEENSVAVSIHCSIDVQVHRCFDGRHYVMNMARLMPSDLPQPGTDEILTHVLRPEFVVANCECDVLSSLPETAAAQSARASSPTSPSSKKGTTRLRAQASAATASSGSRRRRSVSSLRWHGLETHQNTSSAQERGADTVRLCALSADAYSGEFEHCKDAQTNNLLVARASQRMLQHTLPLLVARIESQTCSGIGFGTASSTLGSSWERNCFDGAALVNALHEHGINVRHLGRFADLSKTPHLQELSCVEMVARAAKVEFVKVLSRHLRARLRGGTKSGGGSTMTELKECAVEYFNLVLGSGKECERYWNTVLLPLVVQKFDYGHKTEPSTAEKGSVRRRVVASSVERGTNDGGGRSNEDAFGSREQLTSAGGALSEAARIARRNVCKAQLFAAMQRTCGIVFADEPHAKRKGRNSRSVQDGGLGIASDGSRYMFSCPGVRSPLSTTDVLAIEPQAKYAPLCNEETAMGRLVASTERYRRQAAQSTSPLEDSRAFAMALQAYNLKLKTLEACSGGDGLFNIKTNVEVARTMVDIAETYLEAYERARSSTVVEKKDDGDIVEHRLGLCFSAMEWTRRCLRRITPRRHAVSVRARRVRCRCLFFMHLAFSSDGLDISSIEALGRDILDDMDRDGERSASQRSVQAETFNESEAEAGMSLNLDSSLRFIVSGDISYGVSDRINNERREISLELLARAMREHHLAMRLLRESTTDIDVDRVRAVNLELSAEPGTVHPLAGSLLSSLGELFTLKAECQASRGFELQRMWRDIGEQQEQEENDKTRQKHGVGREALREKLRRSAAAAQAAAGGAALLTAAYISCARAAAYLSTASAILRASLGPQHSALAAALEATATAQALCCALCERRTAAASDADLAISHLPFNARSSFARCIHMVTSSLGGGFGFIKLGGSKDKDIGFEAYRDRANTQIALVRSGKHWLGRAFSSLEALFVVRQSAEVSVKEDPQTLLSYCKPGKTPTPSVIKLISKLSPSSVSLFPVQKLEQHIFAIADAQHGPEQGRETAEAFLSEESSSLTLLSNYSFAHIKASASSISFDASSIFGGTSLSRLAAVSEYAIAGTEQKCEQDSSREGSAGESAAMGSSQQGRRRTRLYGSLSTPSTSLAVLNSREQKAEARRKREVSLRKLCASELVAKTCYAMAEVLSSKESWRGALASATKAMDIRILGNELAKEALQEAQKEAKRRGGTVRGSSLARHNSNGVTSPSSVLSSSAAASSSSSSSSDTSLPLLLRLCKRRSDAWKAVLLSSCAQVAGLAERLEMHSLAAATYEKMLGQLGGDPTGQFRDVQMRVVTVKFAEATHSALTRHELRSALISINLEGSRREKGAGEEITTFPSPELSKFVASKLAEASTPTQSGSKATSSVSSYFDSLMDEIVYDNDVKEEQKSNNAGSFTPAEQLACLYVFVEAHEHAKDKRKGVS